MNCMLIYGFKSQKSSFESSMVAEALKASTDLQGCQRGVWQGPGRRWGHCTAGPDSGGPSPPAPSALGYWPSADLKHMNTTLILHTTPQKNINPTDKHSLEIPFPMSSAYRLRSRVRDASMQEIAGGKNDRGMEICL